VREVKDSIPDLRGGKRLLTKKEFVFLEEYGKNLDKTEAAKIAGYKSANDPMQSPSICAEMEKIQSAWMYEHRMNAKYAGGEHMRLMQKFEDKYDEKGVDSDTQAKFAGVLAKMSEASLKATGRIGANDKPGGGGNVLVQINIPGGENKKPEVVVNGSGPA